MRRLASAALALALLSPCPALAELTASEKAQVKAFVQGGEVSTAGRIRALVARPDLSPEEAAEPLSAGYSAAPFDAARAELTRALLYGPGSIAARNALVGPLVRALLARATHLMARLPPATSALESSDARAIGDEIVRIHRFVTDHVANAGAPPPDGHDGSIAIRDDALRAAATAYARHIEEHAKWLRHEDGASGALLPVRAQAHLALVDLSRGIVARNETAGALGLTGARRGLFERHGALLEDGGAASEARVASAVALIESAPLATGGTSLWIVRKRPAGGVGGRGGVARARTLLTDSPPLVAADRFWPSDVVPATPDAQLLAVADAVAWRVASAAFARRPALRGRAEAAARRAESGGGAAYLAHDAVLAQISPPISDTTGLIGASAELLASGAVGRVLVDAPRAADVALARSLAGNRGPLDQLVLAFELLAAVSSDPSALVVGRTEPDGRITRVEVQLELDGDRLKRFVLDGRTVDVAVGPDGGVASATVDGAPPKLSGLRSVKIVTSAGERWVLAGAELERLSGDPRGVVIDGARFRMTAPEKSGGFDAVATGPAGQPGASVSARLVVQGQGGGLLLNASQGPASYRAVALLVGATPAQAHLVMVDGQGKAFELAPPVSLPPAAAVGYAVTLSATDTEVVAQVDQVKLSAKLGEPLGMGRAGLTVRAQGTVEVADLVVGAPKAKKK